MVLHTLDTTTDQGAARLCLPRTLELAPPRDVQGIHPLSKDGAGESFRDDLVAGEIADHNKKVLGQ